jgi:ribonuclease P protein component
LLENEVVSQRYDRVFLDLRVSPEYGIIMLYTEILNDNRDFLHLYKKGRYIASKYSVIYVKPNGRPFNRLGITAGKKVGNAVCRNRAKRLIRLAYRQSELALPVGIDIVIVARSAICTIRSDEFCSYMEKYGVPEINRCIRKLQNKQL